VLVRALMGQGGWERLQRLAVIARHSTLTAAARQLNTDRWTLGGQVSHIERDLGNAVLIPATAHQPLKLTELGEQVVGRCTTLPLMAAPR
jgi:DNA-binding transcriptional LysR family regulator